MSKKRKYSPLERRARRNTRRIARLEEQMSTLLESVDWPLICAVAPLDGCSGTLGARSRRNRSGGHRDGLVANRHQVGFQ